MNYKEDEKIQEILGRAKDIREELQQPFGVPEIDLEEIEKYMEEAIINEPKVVIDDPNNIFCKCKISKDEALNGCFKEIKYCYMNEQEEKVKVKTKVKIPKDIKDGQKIVFKNSANYMKQNDSYSHLIVEMKVK